MCTDVYLMHSCTHMTYFKLVNCEYAKARAKSAGLKEAPELVQAYGADEESSEPFALLEVGVLAQLSGEEWRAQRYEPPHYLAGLATSNRGAISRAALLESLNSSSLDKDALHEFTCVAQANPGPQGLKALTQPGKAPTLEQESVRVDTLCRQCALSAESCGASVPVNELAEQAAVRAPLFKTETAVWSRTLDHGHPFTEPAVDDNDDAIRALQPGVANSDVLDNTLNPNALQNAVDDVRSVSSISTLTSLDSRSPEHEPEEAQNIMDTAEEPTCAPCPDDKCSTQQEEKGAVDDQDQPRTPQRKPSGSGRVGKNDIQTPPSPPPPRETQPLRYRTAVVDNADPPLEFVVPEWLEKSCSASAPLSDSTDPFAATTLHGAPPPEKEIDDDDREIDLARPYWEHSNESPCSPTPTLPPERSDVVRAAADPSAGQSVTSTTSAASRPPSSATRRGARRGHGRGRGRGGRTQRVPRQTNALSIPTGPLPGLDLSGSAYLLSQRDFSANHAAAHPQPSVVAAAARAAESTRTGLLPSWPRQPHDLAASSRPFPQPSEIEIGGGGGGGRGGAGYLPSQPDFWVNSDPAAAHPQPSVVAAAARREELSRIGYLPSQPHDFATSTTGPFTEPSSISGGRGGDIGYLPSQLDFSANPAAAHPQPSFVAAAARREELARIGYLPSQPHDFATSTGLLTEPSGIQGGGRDVCYLPSQPHAFSTSSGPFSTPYFTGGGGGGNAGIWPSQSHTPANPAAACPRSSEVSRPRKEAQTGYLPSQPYYSTTSPGPFTQPSGLVNPAAALPHSSFVAAAGAGTPAGYLPSLPHDFATYSGPFPQFFGIEGRDGPHFTYRTHNAFNELAPQPSGMEVGDSPNQTDSFQAGSSSEPPGVGNADHMSGENYVFDGSFAMDPQLLDPRLFESQASGIKGAEEESDQPSQTSFFQAGSSLLPPDTGEEEGQQFDQNCAFDGTSDSDHQLPGVECAGCRSPSKPHTSDAAAVLYPQPSSVGNADYLAERIHVSHTLAPNPDFLNGHEYYPGQSSAPISGCLGPGSEVNPPYQAEAMDSEHHPDRTEEMDLEEIARQAVDMVSENISCQDMDLDSEHRTSSSEKSPLKEAMQYSDCGHGLGVLAARPNIQLEEVENLKKAPFRFSDWVHDDSDDSGSEDEVSLIQPPPDFPRYKTAPDGRLVSTKGDPLSRANANSSLSDSPSVRPGSKLGHTSTTNASDAYSFDEVPEEGSIWQTIPVAIKDIQEYGPLTARNIAMATQEARAEYALAAIARSFAQTNDSTGEYEAGPGLEVTEGDEAAADVDDTDKFSTISGVLGDFDPWQDYDMPPCQDSEDPEQEEEQSEQQGAASRLHNMMEDFRETTRNLPTEFPDRKDNLPKVDKPKGGIEYVHVAQDDIPQDGMAHLNLQRELVAQFDLPQNNMPQSNMSQDHALYPQDSMPWDYSPHSNMSSSPTETLQDGDSQAGVPQDNMAMDPMPGDAMLLDPVLQDEPQS